MTEYEIIHAINRATGYRKAQGEKIASNQQKAKNYYKKMRENLDKDEPNYKRDHLLMTLAADALLEAQLREENRPLKKIAIEQMHGEPAWVVSVDCDGRWGIVDANDESIIFPLENDSEPWFMGNYIFQYIKNIPDNYEEYIKILDKIEA